MAVIDHLVCAVADLETGADWFEALTGVRPAPGGSHPGAGTHNALVSMGSSYVELIAPDPAQPAPAAPRPFGLDDASGPGLVAFAVRPDPGGTIDDVLAESVAAGYDPGAPISMSRLRPDGVELHWRLTSPPPGDGGVVPFVIDWGATAFPGATAPGGIELLELEVTHPDPGAVRAVHRALGIDLRIDQGDDAALVARLRSEIGELLLGPAPHATA